MMNKIWMLTRAYKVAINIHYLLLFNFIQIVNISSYPPYYNLIVNIYHQFYLVYFRNHKQKKKKQNFLKKKCLKY